MIYKVEQYVDDENRQMVKKIPQGGGKPTSMGLFTITVPTQFGEQDAQVQFEFPEDYSLGKCFEEFDVLAEKEYDRLMAEMKAESEASKIITPDNRGGIILP